MMTVAFFLMWFLTVFCGAMLAVCTFVQSITLLAHAIAKKSYEIEGLAMQTLRFSICLAMLIVFFYN